MKFYQFLRIIQIIVAQSLSCVRLCNPIDCSMPGFPVLHHLLELAQTDVQWVGDAMQPSHPLSSSSPPIFNLYHYQDLFHWVGSLCQVAQILELQLQHQSFQWIFRVDFILDWLVGSSCYPRDSQESSPTPQFKSINPSALSLLNGYMNGHSDRSILKFQRQENITRKFQM